MDLALAIEKLVPAAKYGGSTTANTKDQYDGLRWEDVRLKPAWKEILSAWESCSLDLEEKKKIDQAESLIQVKMRELAVLSLKEEGKLDSEGKIVQAK